jgi:hypothetical protein
MCFIEVVVVGAAAAELLALRAHVPADKSVLLLTAAPPKLLFLV